MQSYIDKLKLFKKLLGFHPLDFWSYCLTVFKTFQYRYILRCVGKETIVGFGTTIINASRVRIGSHCLIQDHVYMRAGIDGEIVIGDFCAINSFAKLFGHGGIHIGDYSQLGPGVLITTTNHDYGNNLKTAFQQVTIGKSAWIGSNAIILPGIHIGDFTVVGAGSVVTKNIPAYSVSVGNPARVIKKNEKHNCFSV
jgi:acetyltransferase-like isoleucine patch superfamily enzyme